MSPASIEDVIEEIGEVATVEEEVVYGGDWENNRFDYEEDDYEELVVKEVEPEPEEPFIEE